MILRWTLSPSLEDSKAVEFNGCYMGAVHCYKGVEVVQLHKQEFPNNSHIALPPTLFDDAIEDGIWLLCHCVSTHIQLHLPDVTSNH